MFDEINAEEEISERREISDAFIDMSRPDIVNIASTMTDLVKSKREVTNYVAISDSNLHGESYQGSYPGELHRGNIKLMVTWCD